MRNYKKKVEWETTRTIYKLYISDTYSGVGHTKPPLSVKPFRRYWAPKNVGMSPLVTYDTQHTTSTELTRI